MRWLIIPLLPLLLLLPSLPGHAQETLSIAPSPIEVAGENGSPLVATFSLTPNVEMTTVDFLATDLTPTRADQRPVLGTQVTFSPTALQDPEANLRHQVLIAIDNGAEAGTWTGDVLIRWTPRQTGESVTTQEITVPLTVTSVLDPVLVVETPPSVVAQGERGLILYQSPDITRRVTIHSIEEHATATDVSVYVPDLQSPDQRGVFPGSAIDAAIVADTGDPITNLPGGERADVLLTFHPNGVPAGSYAGNLVVQSTEGEEVPIPVQINVKDWWLLPLLALLTGLAISFGITYYRTRIKVKDELRVRIVRMQRNRTESSEFGQHVGSYADGRLELAESHLQNNKPADAEALVAEVETLWNNWLLNRHQLIPLIAALQALITRTDGATEPGVVAVRKEMTDVRDSGLVPYVADPTGLRTKISAWGTTLDGLLPVTRGRSLDSLMPAGALASLDVWDWREPSQRLKLFALVVGLIGFLLLAWAGLQELYLNNATFGSGGIVDYMKLLIWGFGIEATRAQVVTFLQGSGSIVPASV